MLQFDSLSLIENLLIIINLESWIEGCSLVSEGNFEVEVILFWVVPKAENNTTDP